MSYVSFATLFTSSFVTIFILRHAVDVGLWMGVVILSSSVFGALVRWHNKYDRLTVSELFVYLLIAIS